MPFRKPSSGRLGSQRSTTAVAITIVASGTVLLLAYLFLPAWRIAGAAAAFGLGQGVAAPLFAYEGGATVRRAASYQRIERQIERQR